MSRIKTSVVFDSVIQVIQNPHVGFHDNGGKGMLKIYVPITFKGKKFSVVIQEKD